jgi:H+-transporting ATPase
MRVLLFVTLSILVFQFYPVTAIMVVLLAILNDIPIMTIANDNVPTAGHPVRWDMRRVLSVATGVSTSGVISTFLLFWYLRTQVDLSPDVVQTMMFLKLLVAGHTTIFISRSRGWFWQKPYPNWLLLVTLEGTQVVGTLFAVYGLLVPPIGWAKAGIVWAYALAWLPINNVAAVLAAKIAGRSKLG